MTQKAARELPKWMSIVQIEAVLVVALLWTLVGKSVGLRALGVLMVIGALLQQWLGAIPYGWEGREPSGYLTGRTATTFNVVLGLAGFAMAIWGKSLGAFF